MDYRLIGSALARVRWELDINPRWKRDPNFYIDQTLTAVVEALTVPGPYDAARSREILARIENIPSILHQGAENLDKPPAPFASVAIQALENIRPRLHQMANSLAKSTTLKEEELNSATDRAADALERFREKLREMVPSLANETALGRDAYVFFLNNVALMPYSPEDLLAMGRQEWNRAVAFEAFEKNRNNDVPPLKTADNVDNWIKEAAEKELQIRKFLEERRHSCRPELGAALHAASNARVFACIARLRRNGRFHVTIALEGKLHPLCARTFREARLLLAGDSRRPATDYSSRRNSRALFSALSFLETRRPDPAALLRLRRK